MNSNNENYSLWAAAKMGNIDDVREFLEYMDINRQDLSGNTALYYASLCGHYNLVKYLLSVGALDYSSRAYWNALNTNIRNLFNGIDSYEPEKEEKKLEQEQDVNYSFKFLLPLPKSNDLDVPISPGISGYKSDFIIWSGERFGQPKKYYCHLCVLLPRWNYLFQLLFKDVEYDESAIEKKLKSILEKGEIEMDMSPFTLSAILRHLYTNEVHFIKNNEQIPMENVKELYDVLLSHESIYFLKELAKNFKNLKVPFKYPDINMGTHFDFGFLNDETKLMDVQTIKENILNELKDDEKFLNLEKNSKQEKVREILRKRKDFEKIKIIMKYLSDLRLTSTNKKRELLAHKALIVSRSSYFNVLLGGVFSKVDDKLVTELTENSMYQLIRFLYTNKVELTNEIVVELLIASNKYNIDTLKKKCEKFISNEITNDNFIELLKVAELSNSGYLKLLCTRYVSSTEYLKTEKNLILIYNGKKYPIQKYYFGIYSNFFMNMFLNDEKILEYDFKDENLLNDEEFEMFLNLFSCKNSIVSFTKNIIVVHFKLMVFCEKYQFGDLFMKIQSIIICYSTTFDELLEKLYCVLEYYPNDSYFFQSIYDKTIKTLDDQNKLKIYLKLDKSKKNKEKKYGKVKKLIEKIIHSN